MGAEAALKLGSTAIQPAAQVTPEPVTLPATALEEGLAFDRSVKRSTRDSIFVDLVRIGGAWRDARGVRCFDVLHPRMKPYLAGRSDELFEDAHPEDQRPAILRVLLIESVLRRVAGAPAFKGRAEVYQGALDELAPSLLEGAPIPSLRTYRGWQQRYLASGRLRSSQLDTRGGRSGRERVRFSAEARAYFKGVYLTRQCRSIKNCWLETMAKADSKGWDCPGYEPVKRWARKHLPPRIADYYRRGPRAWRMRHQPKLVVDTRDLPGNHTWVIDNLRFDFWARLGPRRVRLWCSLIIDRASNLIVGWAITTNPSQDSLILALRRAVKRHGPPLEVILDNGRDMRSDAFAGKNRKWVAEELASALLSQLGIILHFCQPYSPWSKGGVEAMARTIHAQFDRLFRSFCGGSPADKPEGVDRWCREHHDELPTVPEVEAAFAQFVETFADRPSDAQWVKPLSPRQRFEQTRIAKRTLPDHLLNVLLLKLTGPRRVTSKGVLYNGLHYTASRMFGEDQHSQVRLRIDPDDVSRVWVCDLKGRPKYIARQNLVKGTLDDVRVAMNRRSHARRVVREAHQERTRALDDLPMAVLRSQAERYRSQTRQNDPPAGSPAPTVAPIVTPAAQQIIAAAAVVERQERQDAMRAHPFQGPAAVQGLSRDELDALSAGDDDLLMGDDVDDLDALCG